MCMLFSLGRACGRVNNLGLFIFHFACFFPLESQSCLRNPCIRPKQLCQANVSLNYCDMLVNTRVYASVTNMLFMLCELCRHASVVVCKSVRSVCDKPAWWFVNIIVTCHLQWCVKSELTL